MEQSFLQDNSQTNRAQLKNTYELAVEIARKKGNVILAFKLKHKLKKTKIIFISL